MNALKYSTCQETHDVLNADGQLLPNMVMQAIDKVTSCGDPLSGQQFNSVDYINSLFPTEQSLSNLDYFISQLECKIKTVDEEIRTMIKAQTNVSKEGQSMLENADRVIRQLSTQTLEIKCKAELAEESMKETTRDIKQLDCAKRNLTEAITMLNNLHMLVGSGLNQLKVLIGSRQYGDIVMPLQGVLDVMKHFHNYSDIPQIKKLAGEVHGIQNILSQQINQDFYDAFAGDKSSNFTSASRSLTEACLVIDILEPKVKHDLLRWFVDLQLHEYQVMFAESEENAWLDKIDCRYSWFKKYLLQWEQKFGAMFPSSWQVSEKITTRFCQITKSELSKIMSKRAKEIDVKLLLYAIQRTAAFEQLLSTRFTGETILQDNVKNIIKEEKSLNTKPSTDSICVSGNSKPVCYSDGLNISNNCSDSYDSNCSKGFAINQQNTEQVRTQQVTKLKTSLFHNIIGECFSSYLFIYVDSLDRNMLDLMEKLVAESKQDLNNKCVEGVLPSSADLFMFYKKFLVQCDKLSNGIPMVSLSLLFGKYLREYALKILQNNLPKSVCTPNNSLTVNGVSITSASLLIQNFLKEEAAKLTKQEIAKVCRVLTTAEYCLETTRQLEDKLRDKVERSLVDKINLSQEQDVFHSVVSNCVEILVQDLMMACEPALTFMTKIQWKCVESVGDQSSYVTTIINHLKIIVPFIKDCLSSSRKYFTQFCVKFANSFIVRFIQVLYKCKPLSMVGAEQLLLDTHMLKTQLLDLFSLDRPCILNKPAPATYTKVIVKGMVRAEMLLKIVMTPVDSGAFFVDQFLKLLPDASSQEFQKVLDMKNLNTAEKNNLVLIYHQKSVGFVTNTPANIIKSKMQ